MMQSLLSRLSHLAGFVVFFHRELVLANLRLAVSVFSPLRHLRPAVLAVPLDIRSELALTVLANLVSLTPGTLSLDISADRGTLFVHAAWVDDAERFRRDIKENYERRVREIFP